jgi:transposase-like protein
LSTCARNLKHWQDGDVIDILVQPHHDQRAAERFLRKLLRGQGSELLQIITDKLRSYSAAMRSIFSNVTHRGGAVRQQSRRSLASADDSNLPGTHNVFSASMMPFEICSV